MQKVHNQVKPLLLNKGKTFFSSIKKTDAFLGHCECDFIRCLLFRGPAKHQTKGDILSRPQKKCLATPFLSRKFSPYNERCKQKVGAVN